ncbi:hypothetical protein BT96DRAFT_1002050 [Gymnopus androsaceus JB14]|uniref:Helicase ATP-binding domain-containing protein n=1 Tax=Gymnopus androsaceus JB14 TaxID=1447944 RepID=A0A6A4H0E8_9AGAR|nr:hypothetical protein BT96DRAFT_1002050 [Gymnopus androsaceus JB14]
MALVLEPYILFVFQVHSWYCIILSESTLWIGIPAIALTRETEDLEKELKAFSNGDYHVGFVGPEMALNNRFHELVIESRKFQRNIIAAVVDESHNISEWGTDDFRPILDVFLHFLDAYLSLGIGGRCEHIAVSNEKPNVSLAVRIMQHPPDSYVDLLTLFPKNPTCTEDFEQTLIYVNSRQEAERIQDFLRKHAPEHIDGT